MRSIFSLFLISILFLQVQAKSDKEFSQDVAFVHGKKQNLPEGVVSEIILQDGKPLILISGHWWEFDGTVWKEYRKKLKVDIPTTPMLPPPAQVLLSQVDYQDGTAIGCDNGLYLVNKK